MAAALKIKIAPHMRGFPKRKPAVTIAVKPPGMDDGDDMGEEAGEPLSFKAPDGFDTEGKQPGDTIEAVAELEIGPDDTLVLKKLNGIDVGSEEEPDAGPPEPPKPGLADAVMAPEGGA